MLTDQQRKDRRLGIGASDAPRIIAGDWHSLFLEKTGRAEGKDLSDVFAVQLGHATEKLNCDWCERKLGERVVFRGDVFVSREHPFLRCTLDGGLKYPSDPLGPAVVVEAKHVNAFSKLDEVTARYSPQCNHQMLVTGARTTILSVIVGTNEPELIRIDFDEFWANEYTEKCREFWQHVIDDRAPEQGAPMEIAPAMPISDMRTLDMGKNNAWVSHATDWLANKSAAAKFDGAAKELKKMVDADVRFARGAGVQIERKTKGLFITEIK